MLHLNDIKRVPEHIVYIPADAIPYIKKAVIGTDIRFIQQPIRLLEMGVDGMQAANNRSYELLGDDLAITPVQSVPCTTDLDDVELFRELRRLYANPIEPTRYAAIRDGAAYSVARGENSTEREIIGTLVPDTNDEPVPEPRTL